MNVNLPFNTLIVSPARGDESYHTKEQVLQAWESGSAFINELRHRVPGQFISIRDLDRLPTATLVQIRYNEGFHVTVWKKK